MTNVRTQQLTPEATVKGICQDWYDPTHVAHIFGLSHLKEKHRTTYDSDKEDEFMLHTKPGIIKFKATTEGLYVFKTPTIYLKDVVKAM